MTQVTYIQPDGSEKKVDVPAGMSLMHGAVLNDVPGIVAECGGSAMCATCHVYLDPSCIDMVPPVAEVEIDMLESASSERKENSRLSCQLIATEELEALTVHIPLHQS